MDLQHKDSSVTLTLLLLALAVIVGYFVLHPSKPQATPSPVPAENVSTSVSPVSENPSDNVTVANVSLEKKLPTGFPSVIPVERANILESYKVVYKNHNNVTQYTVSYTSKDSVGNLWDVYADFLRNEEYVLDTAASDKKLGIISGTKGNNTLSVIVSSRDKVSFVQLNLLYR